MEEKYIILMMIISERMSVVKTSRMRRFKSICVLLSLMVLVIEGISPTTVMADDTKIVEAVNSGPYWSSSGSWNSWKSWYINKGYTINGSGKTILWWNRKDHEAWWLGVKDKNGNSKWALLFDGVQTTSGNYITRYNGWMPVREGNDIVWYYLDNEGLTYTNMWVHTRCVDANYKSSDKHGHFYFDGNGRLQTGWHRDSSGRWYYSDGEEGSVNPGINKHGGLAWTTIKNPMSYEKDGLYSNGLYYLNGLNVVTNVYRMNTNGTYDYVGNAVNNIKVGDDDDQINPLKEKTINADTDYVNKQIYNSNGLFINTNIEGSCTQQQNLALKNDDYKQIKINEFTYYIDRKKFTLTQNINSDTETTKTSSIYFEGATTIEDPSAKTGYTFATWDLQGKGSELNGRTFVMGDEDAVLTAQWTPVNYSVSYSLNGGSISGQPTSYNVESATFTLPTPSKFGYTFTGWTGTGLSGLTKTVTVSKGSTGNRTYTAHFEKTVTATFKYYNNQIVTVTGKITDSATSVAVKAPAASGTPSGYTFRGWSTSSAANASVNAAASASVTISANMTYYASYSKNVTATFHYCTLAADNYTYTNGAQKSAAASATQYLGYAGAVVNSNIAIPTAVTASHGGASAQNYVGVSKDTNSVSTVTPTTAYTKYYAVYTEPLKFYYYNGTNDTSTSVTRRMLSNGSAYSNSLSASAPAPAAYDGAAFAGWSCDSGVSDSSSLRKPLETGVNSLYAVYKKNVSISYNANGGSGAPAAQSGIKYYAKMERGSNITNPSITVTSSKPSRGGYNFSSWNTSANGRGTVYKAGTAYAVSANVTLYAQWQYNPVSVKVPQILTGDHTGRSQFRVKCDDFKAGNIKVTVPNSFLYKQTGKADVTAAITAKSGNNTITPSNKVCVYNITTRNGLSAGCWSGSFNIGLTLTKE